MRAHLEAGDPVPAVALVLGGEAREDVLVAVHDAEREEGALLQPLHDHHALRHRVRPARVVRRLALRLPVRQRRPVQPARTPGERTDHGALAHFAKGGD